MDTKPRTLGDLRVLTAALPDETLLAACYFSGYGDEGEHNESVIEIQIEDSTRISVPRRGRKRALRQDGPPRITFIA